jgi:ribosomal protein S18 acetylase RimI-like enzyme
MASSKARRVGRTGVRVVRPTAKGRREQAEINRRADAATEALIEHLGTVERHQVREALGTVERLFLVSSLRAHEATVRPARRADARAVARLLRTTFDEQRRQFTAAAFAASTPTASEIADRVVHHAVWVAEWDGRIVGTVSAEARPPSCWVRSLAVDPSLRGLRIGERLLDEVVRHVVDSGLVAVELDTTPFQEAASRLYRRFGFRHVKCHEVYGTTMNQLRKALPGSSRDVTDEVSRSRASSA